MDGLFFIASKTVGMVARVETWVLLLLLLALAGLWRGRVRLARRAVGLCLLLVGALTVFPLGTLLMAPLERQYPPAPTLGRVDGIIVLGGAEDLGAYAAWGETGFNAAAERATAGVELARRFPQARLVFTGGAASLVRDEWSAGPSQMTRAFWIKMGVPEAQIVIEDRSRNTSENAVFTRDLVQPQEGEVWLLVTSAFHMPRSMETFRRAGWTGLVAWPVDFRSGGSAWRAEWRLDDHLMNANIALKEYLGTLAYRVAGK
jgi:uncharacterized SAM-binding protein YcdF (DUF218 family)